MSEGEQHGEERHHEQQRRMRNDRDAARGSGRESVAAALAGHDLPGADDGAQRETRMAMVL